jgi:hypothetical protein
MRWSNWRYFVGGGLLLLGVIALLQVLGVIPTEGTFGALIFGVIFGAVGIAFLTVLINGRHNWWAVIPGVVLLSLAVLILLGAFAPTLASAIGGAVFLGGISLAFWLVLILTPHNWWALIPAGVLLTLAAVTVIPETGGLETGGIFFLGLSLTFLALALVPVEGRRMTWPLIPGGILFVMGVLLLLTQTDLINFIWPIALILVGLFLVLRPFLRRNRM